jgi:hypothetical protein
MNAIAPFPFPSPEPQYREAHLMVGFAICLLSALRFADVGRTLDNLAIALDEFSSAVPGERERRIFRSAAHLIMEQQEHESAHRR